jgi:hypothetical protein
MHIYVYTYVYIHSYTGLVASQICLKLLMEINETLRVEQIAKSPLGGLGRIGDTSQKGIYIYMSVCICCIYICIHNMGVLKG